MLVRQLRLQRGWALMFLGLMKYYRISYLDLFEFCVADKTEKHYYSEFINRCFDRIEIAYSIEWSSQSNDSLLNELQDSNRKMTNEKNRYLTIFESSFVPMIYLDEQLEISNLNHAATELFTDFKVAGSMYYRDNSENLSLKNLSQQILQFANSNSIDSSFETILSKSFKFKSLTQPRFVLSNFLDFSVPQ
jgi:hypothetical protein